MGLFSSISSAVSSAVSSFSSAVSSAFSGGSSSGSNNSTSSSRTSSVSGTSSSGSSSKGSYGGATTTSAGGKTTSGTSSSGSSSRSSGGSSGSSTSYNQYVGNYTSKSTTSPAQTYAASSGSTATTTSTGGKTTLATPTITAASVNAPAAKSATPVILPATTTPATTATTRTIPNLTTAEAITASTLVSAGTASSLLATAPTRTTEPTARTNENFMDGIISWRNDMQQTGINAYATGDLAGAASTFGVATVADLALPLDLIDVGNLLITGRGDQITNDKLLAAAGDALCIGAGLVTGGAGYAAGKALKAGMIGSGIALQLGSSFAAPDETETSTIGTPADFTAADVYNQFAGLMGNPDVKMPSGGYLGQNAAFHGYTDYYAFVNTGGTRGGSLADPNGSSWTDTPDDQVLRTLGLSGATVYTSRDLSPDEMIRVQNTAISKGWITASTPSIMDRAVNLVNRITGSDYINPATGDLAATPTNTTTTLSKTTATNVPTSTTTPSAPTATTETDKSPISDLLDIISSIATGGDNSDTKTAGASGGNIMIGSDTKTQSYIIPILIAGIVIVILGYTLRKTNGGKKHGNPA